MILPAILAASTKAVGCGLAAGPFIRVGVPLKTLLTWIGSGYYG